MAWNSFRNLVLCVFLRPRWSISSIRSGPASQIFSRSSKDMLENGHMPENGGGGGGEDRGHRGG